MIEGVVSVSIFGKQRILQRFTKILSVPFSKKLEIGITKM